MRNFIISFIGMLSMAACEKKDILPEESYKEIVTRSDSTKIDTCRDENLGATISIDTTWKGSYHYEY